MAGILFWVWCGVRISQHIAPRPINLVRKTKPVIKMINRLAEGFGSTGWMRC